MARDERGRLEREFENPPAAMSPPPVLPPPPLPLDYPFLAWGEDMETSVELQSYLDRAKAPQPEAFPPFAALSKGLHEMNSGAACESDTTPGTAARPGASPQPRAANDLVWFDANFRELKTMLLHQNASANEIVSINIKLAQIIERVDRLAAALPGEKTMAAVETQLSELTRSIAAAREQSATDANRIARAAEEILAVTVKTKDAARDTVKELGSAFAVTAAKAARITAEEIAAALRERRDDERFERMEGELRALNSASKESGERTAAALERVHETLRQFLQTGQGEPAAAFSRKRAGVHTPISSGAQEYTIGDDFGSEPEKKPRLDTITLRKPPPPDPNFIEALKKAGEQVVVSQGSRGSKHQGAAPATARHAPRPFHRDEERALPLLGLGIVAVILLIASAALYYLQTKTELPPFHLSVLPDLQIAKPSQASPPPVFQGEPGRAKTATPSSNPAPSLFTAADQARPEPSREAEVRDDLQLLANAASRGDRDAQYRIAARFLSDGSPQGDAATAARWLARAAGQGHTESQFVLASLYERGVGLPRDEEAARDLYRKAASAGHIRSMHNLAVMLCAHSTPQDYQEAAAFFANAAMSGLTDSQFNLAVLYERGLGLQQNNRKAFFWYEVASLAGDREATRQAERLKRELPSSETEAAAEQANSWRPSVEKSRQPGNAARG